VLAKHGLPFAVDAEAQLASVDRLDAGEWAVLLPAHGEPVRGDARAALCRANRDAILRGLEATLSATAEPAETGTVVAVVAQSLGLRLADFVRYHLVRTTILAYLSHWLARGRVLASVRAGRLWWARAGA
jgi:hypothetical protein